MASNIRSISSNEPFDLHNFNGKLLEDGIATIPAVYESYNNTRVISAGTTLSADTTYTFYNIKGSGYSTVTIRTLNNNKTISLHIYQYNFNSNTFSMIYACGFNEGIGGTRSLGFTMGADVLYKMSVTFDYQPTNIISFS